MDPIKISQEWFDTYAAAKERMLELQATGHLVRLVRADGKKGSKFLGNIFVEYTKIPGLKSFGNPPMKSTDFQAVIVEDEVFCRGCIHLPSLKNKHALPIFPHDTWPAPGPTCTVCGKLHTYMVLERQGLENPPRKAHHGGQGMDAWNRAILKAFNLGMRHGENAASWQEQYMFGGRVTRGGDEAARKIIEGIDEGDPEVMDPLEAMVPNLSGEWGGEMTPQMLEEAVGAKESDDMALAQSYEDGAHEGFFKEIYRLAKSMTHENPKRAPLTVVGKRCTLIEGSVGSWKGKMGRILGDTEGNIIIEGDFTGVGFSPAKIGLLEAIEYLDDAKARKEGLDADGRPWRHDFKTQDVTILRIPGGILIVGDKPLWEVR
jgi:hypothetical protein